MNTITLVKTTTNYCGDEKETDVVCRVGKAYIITPNKTRINIKYFLNYSPVYYKGAYYEWKNPGDKDYFKKLEQVKQAEKELKLDFDGEISVKEIANKFANYYVNCKRTKIKFHKRTAPDRYCGIPEMSINIKPSRIERFANGSITYVYNEKEFNEKMAKAKPINHTLDKVIKDDLYNKYHIIVFEKNKYFCVGMSYKGERKTMWNDWSHNRGCGKVKYSEYTKEKLYEVAKNVYELNKNLY